MARHWSEIIARDYLLAQGYHLLQENYCIRGAELDLIMQDGAHTVFIEVKQRANSRHGSPAEHISAAKLGRMRRAALHYLLARFGHEQVPCRFDAVTLLGTKQHHHLQHLKHIL